MALEQCLAQEWRSASESEDPNDCFNCNICFEYADDPVVTLCGHLYCWACIYKWFHFQSTSLASDEHPQCPICKAEISHTRVIPLYGRGQSPSDASLKGKSSSLGLIIPTRPPAFEIHDLANTPRSGQRLPYRNPYQNDHYDRNLYEGYEEENSITQPGYYHPVVGMFGGFVYPRVFGNSESLLAYPNTYNVMGSASSNPRLRRLEMQADKSLSRISFFLLCCVFVCLLVF